MRSLAFCLVLVSVLAGVALGQEYLLQPLQAILFENVTAVAAVQAAAGSPLVAIGDSGGQVRLFSLDAGSGLLAAVAEFAVGDSRVFPLVFSPDGRYLAAAGTPGVVVYDLVSASAPLPVQTYSQVCPSYWSCRTVTPYAMAFVPRAPKPKLALSLDTDQIQLWSIESDTIESVTLPGGWSPKALAFPQSGDFLFATGLSSGSAIYAWQTSALDAYAPQAQRSSGVTAFAVLEEAGSLFAAYEDGVAGVWNLGSVVPTLQVQERLPQGTVVALAYEHEGDVLAALVRRSSGAGLDLAVWSTDGQKYTAVPFAHTMAGAGVYVAVIGEGTLLTCGGEGLFKIWRLRW